MNTVGRNKKIIAEYIRNQLEEDYAADQISIKEYVDPFTGDKNKKYPPAKPGDISCSVKALRYWPRLKALVRLAIICIGPPTHTGISPSPFPSHIAAIPYIYTFFFCLIIFQQQSLLLSHNLLNGFSHFILEWPPSVL